MKVGEGCAADTTSAIDDRGCVVAGRRQASAIGKADRHNRAARVDTMEVSGSWADENLYLEIFGQQPPLQMLADESSATGENDDRASFRRLRYPANTSVQSPPVADNRSRKSCFALERDSLPEEVRGSVRDWTKST